MILTDAGPLVALIDRGEPEHARCVAAFKRLSGPMLTTWPACTEAIYLLGEARGFQAQGLLWRLIERGDLVVEMPARPSRVAELMSTYADLPMDLADASIVALADERRLRSVFTLDADFRVYRSASGRAFTLIP